MDRLSLYRSLARPADTRVLYFIADGIGGLPRGPDGKTELEMATTPTFDRLANEGSTGLVTPVAPGIAPGSGPAHLALFGFDPLQTSGGRGVLAALGVNFDLKLGDIAARINFCTLDNDGRVTDRRAGRIGSEVGALLSERLDGIDLGSGIDCFVRHVKEYRACVVFRGESLEGNVTDTDPQDTGVEPLAPKALDAVADATAALASEFVLKAGELLLDEEVANGILLRGFDKYVPLPSFAEL